MSGGANPEQLTRTLHIVSIGDELLSGAVVDTNAAYLEQQLLALGWQPQGVTLVGDDTAAIASAIRAAVQSAALVMVTGGLGPTGDDRTRDGLARALEDVLVFDAELLAQVAECFRRMNRPMTDSNRTQALRPSTAGGLFNACGTAPGLTALWRQSRIFVLPGVPSEMRRMFIEQVLPRLPRLSGSLYSCRREAHFCGVGESVLGEALGASMHNGADPQTGTCVHDGLVTVSFRSWQPDAETRIAAAQAHLAVQFPGSCLAAGDNSLAEAVFRKLQAQKATAATAESCTGGLCAALLVEVAGVSECYRGGIIAYSNAVKEDQLQVSAAILAEDGAVSRRCAAAMAVGAAQKFRADWGVAITGIAGPGGGNSAKPVGLVWMAVAGPGELWTCRRQFGWDRRGIRERAAWTSLDLLRRALEKNLTPGDDCWKEQPQLP